MARARSVRIFALIVLTMGFVCAGSVAFPALLGFLERTRGRALAPDHALALRWSLLATAIWGAGVALWSPSREGEPAFTRARWGAGLLLLYALASCAVFAWVGGSHHDLCAFLEAGRLSLQGDWRSLYEPARYAACGYAYVYPPPSTVLFWPFAALPGHAGGVVYGLLQAAAAYGALRWAAKLGTPDLSEREAFFAVIPWMASLPLATDLMAGNITAFELFALAWMMQPREGRPMHALGKGVVVALVCGAKIYGLVIALLLAVIWRHRFVLAGLLLGVSAQAVISIVFLRPALWSWWETAHRVAGEGGSLVSLIRSGAGSAGATAAVLAVVVVSVWFSIAAFRIHREAPEPDAASRALGLLAIGYVGLVFPRWNLYSYALVVLALFACPAVLTRSRSRALFWAAWGFIGFGGLSGLMQNFVPTVHARLLVYYAVVSTLWFTALAVWIYKEHAGGGAYRPRA